MHRVALNTQRSKNSRNAGIRVSNVSDAQDTRANSELLESVWSNGI
jgi:hypothetical protein